MGQPLSSEPTPAALGWLTTPSTVSGHLNVEAVLGGPNHAGSDFGTRLRGQQSEMSSFRGLPMVYHL